MDGFYIMKMSKCEVPHEIIKLKLVGKNIQEIVNDDLKFFNNLIDLDLSENQVNFDQIPRPWKCKAWKWTKDVTQYGKVFNHNPEACIYRGFLEGKKDVWEKVSSQDLQQNISKIDFD